MPPTAAESLALLGGCARWEELAPLVSRPALARAVEEGSVRRTARGRYALPVVDEAEAAAHRLTGALVLRSAALAWGWEVLKAPTLPEVGVPRGRKVPTEQGAGVDVHHYAFGPDDVVDHRTSKAKTLEQCLRALPEIEALAIADSAARHEGPTLLRFVARTVQGPGAPRVRRLIELADDRAANPFESALRWLALQVPGLHVEPQRVITLKRATVRPDLVDVDLRIVLEADSLTWHGDKHAMDRDCTRYNRLLAAGWLVLRLTWTAVVVEQQETLELLADLTEQRIQIPPKPPEAA